MRGKLLFGAASAAILAALSGAASAQTADPADDATTSAQIASGDAVESELSPAGDIDWFRLNVTPSTRYQITLDSAAELGAEGGFDPVLVVYDADGAEVARNDDANETLNSALSYRSTGSGHVFVEARGFLEDATGRYVLSVSESPIAPDDAGDSADTRARLTLGQPASGVIGEAEDQDWYRLSVRTDQIYRFALNGEEAGGEALGDPLLRIVGADGEEELAYNDDGPDSLNSYLEFVPRNAGDVFVIASSFNGATGAYTLSAEAERLPPDEAGAATTTRARINVGASADGALDYAGDRDWYRVRLTEGESYRFTLSSNTEDGGFDPTLAIADRAGEQLAYDDDGGGNLNSYLEFTAGATGDYYLDVGGYSEAATGAYTLSARAGDIPGDASTDASLSAEGDWRQGVLSPAGDTDWYRIELTEGQSLRVGLNSSLEDAMPLSDPYVAIRGPDGVELAGDDDGGLEGLDSLLEYTATQTGPHFIEARGLSVEDGEGRYAIEILPGEIGADFDTADYLAIGQQRDSRIGAAGDADWFYVDLIEGRPYRFNLLSSEFDTVLTLLSPEGVEVASNDDGGTQTNSYLTFMSPTGGSYIASVSAYDEQGAGGYSLYAYDTDVPGTYGTDEYLDSSVGDDRASAIEFEGDKDSYSVSLDEGRTYLIEVVSEGERPLRNPALTVLNSSGEEVASDEDGGAGLNAQLRFTPESTDIYYIQARGGPSQLGGYRITVTPEG